MKIKLKLEADSAAEIRSQLQELLGVYGGNVVEMPKIDHSAIQKDIDEGVKNTKFRTDTLEKASIDLGEKLGSEVELIKTEEVKPEPRKRASRKTETPKEEVAKEEVEVAKEEVEVAKEETPESEKPKIGFEDIKSLTLKAGADGKRDDAIAILTKLGVARISELKEDQHQEYYDALSKIVKP